MLLLGGERLLWLLLFVSAQLLDPNRSRIPEGKEGEKKEPPISFTRSLGRVRLGARKIKRPSMTDRRQQERQTKNAHNINSNYTIKSVYINGGDKERNIMTNNGNKETLRN